MFGYVIADLGRLTEAQRLRYHSVYCGLCRALYADYGAAGALALTYDMTFLALLLVRAAKLPHPLGKLLSLPAALLLVIRFVPGVLYQLSLFPLAAPLPFITGNLYSVIDALLLGLSVSALRQSTCPEPPEIRSVQPAVV